MFFETLETDTDATYCLKVRELILQRPEEMAACMLSNQMHLNKCTPIVVLTQKRAKK